MGRKNAVDRGVYEETEVCAACAGVKCADCRTRRRPPCPLCLCSSCTECGGKGKVGTGLWSIRYADPKIAHKEHREQVGKKMAAQRLYQKRKQEIRDGKFFPEDIGNKRKPQVSLKQILNTQLDVARDVKVSCRNEETYTCAWWAFLGDVAAADVTPSDIERWRSKHAHLSLQTIKQYIEFLGRAYARAIRDKHVTDNPVDGVQLVAPNNERVRWLNEIDPKEGQDPEETRLRKQIEKCDWLRGTGQAFFRAVSWPIVRLALLTGMRRGELFGSIREDGEFYGLQWRYISFERGVVKIPRAKGRSKAGRPRYVRLNNAAIELLRALPSRLKSPWVFPSMTDPEKPLDAHNWENRVWCKAVDRGEIEDFHFHDLRHTFASRLAMKGVSLLAIARLLGHATTKVTERYAHLHDDHLAAAAELLSEVEIIELVDQTEPSSVPSENTPTVSRTVTDLQTEENRRPATSA